MKKRGLAIAALGAGSLCGSLTEPVRLEYITGYRSDRLHWHTQTPGDGGELLYSEIYKNLQFWENGLGVIVYHRDIYFFLEGSYAAFGLGGEGRQRYASLDFTDNQPRFSFIPKGWATDGIGRFGYCVNLTNGRLYKVVLIPFVGCSAHYESLERKNPKPKVKISDSYAMSSQLPGRANLTWYGFLLGGMFHIDPGERMVFDVGYNYSWLHVRFHTHYANQVALVSTEESSQTSLKAKTGGNLGHTGWAKAVYRIDSSWQAGLEAQIQYSVSKEIGAAESTSLNGAEPAKTSPKLKIRWTTVSGWVNISRNF